MTSFLLTKGTAASHFCLLQIWDKNTSVLNGLHLHVERSETEFSLPVFHS